MKDYTAQLDRVGYAHLPTFLSPHLIACYNTKLRHVLNDCMQAPVQHIAFSGANAVFRVNELLRYFGAHTLFILGMPALRELTQTLCEDEVVCMYESLLVRSAENASVVDWHRDMNHQEAGRIFTLGIYLDAALPEEDALQVLPGHHLSATSIGELTSMISGKEITPLKLAAEAGDLLIHDVRLPHASSLIISKRVRKTLYFEFRPLRLLRNANPQWLTERRRLNDIAQAAYVRLSHSDETDWTLTQEETDWLETLYQHTQRLEGAEYASNEGQR